ncbi:hypothetical protein [Azotobacter vinelandii]
MINRFRLPAISAIAASFLLNFGVYAAMQNEPPISMSQMAHDKSDQEVAAEFKDEATMLREKADLHRKLAQNYRARSGKLDFEQVARHCDRLAQLYEDAAKEAEAVSVELSK